MRLTMLLAAMTPILGLAAVCGVTGEQDEGAAAHVFQLVMAAQVPVIVYFAARCLHGTPLPKPATEEATEAPLLRTRPSTVALT